MASGDRTDAAQPRFSYPEHLVNSLIFETFGDQRYTQDSPVMPEVWLAYARAPRQRLDLLLTPRSGDSPSQLASRVAERLAVLKGVEIKDEERDAWPIWEDHGIAYSRSSVVAKVTFRELICVIVPMTMWWQSLSDSEVGDPSKRAETVDAHDYEQLRSRIEKLARDKMRLSDIILNASKIMKRSAWDFIRFCALVGLIGLACEYENALEAAEQQFNDAPSKTKAARNKLDRLCADNENKLKEFMRRLSDRDTPVADVMDVIDAYGRIAGCILAAEKRETLKIFMVTKNRDAQLSIVESRGTIKADAANNVFHIDTGDLAWAIIDGGIDARQPAFLNRAATMKQLEQDKRSAEKRNAEARTAPAAADGPTSDQANSESASSVAELAASKQEPAPLTDEVWKHDIPIDRLLKLSRVRESYDFTYLRQMLATRDLPPPDKGGPPKAIADYIRDKHDTELRDLRTRTSRKREIDWDIVAPLIQIPHDHNYDRPTIGHGTHVAGILGADWRAEDNSEMLNLIGVCPQIQLYDLRVFKPGFGSDEFTVQYALQFVQHLNRNRDMPRIHGVNLSLSMLHKVMSFACGRTPVCDECNDLVGTGVVVVVAAGNDGYKTYKTDKGDYAGYHAASITDPGNAEDVITVGATHRSHPHNYGVSYFSSRGPTGDGRRKPDLVAPGEKITAPVVNCGVQRMDGTSMAAPHVSGAAALLMARHRELIAEPRRIKQILCETATDLGRERHFQGAGMVDILRALQSV